MAIKDRLSGNEAVSIAIKQINPDVVAAFPITPSTEIPQFISQFIANGEMTTVFVPVESEHSSMSACVGSEAAGARSMTATSSCGLAYMHEMLYIAASNRLPIVMAAVNRALSGPININNDHSDTMGSRDALAGCRSTRKTRRKLTTTLSRQSASPSTKTFCCRLWPARTALSPPTP